MKIKNIRKSENLSIICAIVAGISFTAGYLIAAKQEKLPIVNENVIEATNENTDELGELSIYENGDTIHFHFANDKYVPTAETEHATITQEKPVSHGQFLVDNGIFLNETAVTTKKDALCANTIAEFVDNVPDNKPVYDSMSDIGRYVAGTIFMNDKGDVRISYSDEDSYQLVLAGYKLTGYQVNNRQSDYKEFYQDEDLVCTEGLDLSLTR